MHSAAAVLLGAALLRAGGPAALLLGMSLIGTALVRLALPVLAQLLAVALRVAPLRAALAVAAVGVVLAGSAQANPPAPLGGPVPATTVGTAAHCRLQAPASGVALPGMTEPVVGSACPD